MHKEKAIKNKELMVIAAELSNHFPFLNVEYATGKGYLISYDLDSEPELVWPIGERPVIAQVAQAFLVGMRDAALAIKPTFTLAN